MTVESLTSPCVCCHVAARQREQLGTLRCTFYDREVRIGVGAPVPAMAGLLGALPGALFGHIGIVRRLLLLREARRQLVRALLQLSPLLLQPAQSQQDQLLRALP